VVSGGGIQLSTGTTASVPSEKVPKKIQTTQKCPLFSISLKLGSKGPEVKKVQQFLILQDEGPAAQALAKNGPTTYFGILTRRAVAEFQTKYFNDILLPAGFKKATGWWYSNTVKKANGLAGCNARS
jgi:peptidoglycan hydrolase-like protein with peptidoglycan-binding domain